MVREALTVVNVKLSSRPVMTKEKFNLLKQTAIYAKIALLVRLSTNSQINVMKDSKNQIACAIRQLTQTTNVLHVHQDN